jgi:dihydropyrimidine dehydrogenase (NAD+) subunit PreA
VARIHAETCIGCDLCYIACWDGAHQCIHREGFAKPEEAEASTKASRVATPIAKLDANGAGAKTPAHRIPKVDEHECVGCNLCWLVCPVPGCITMERVDTGAKQQSWEQRANA